MTGFPDRPIRTDLGADLENYSPVVDVKHHLDADDLELRKFQLAGLGLVSPRVVISGKTSVSAPEVDFLTEAWNTEQQSSGAYAKPVIAKTSTGLFTVTWAATVPNEAGELRPLNLRWAIGFPAGISANPQHVQAWPTSQNVITVKCWESIANVDTLTDMFFLVIGG